MIEIHFNYLFNVEIQTHDELYKLSKYDTSFFFFYFVSS